MTPSHKPDKDGFFRTIRADMRRGDFGETVGRDYKGLRDFALDEEQQRRLRAMSPLRQWWVAPWWILKRLFFALTPARRLLVVLAGLLVLASRHSGNTSTGLAPAGGLLLLFVLFLELKDKLAAKRELDAGHAVQRALQPEPSPHFPGWDLWLYTRPANEVGGDLVEFLRLDEGRAAVAIADVAGKGLGAALLAAKVQTMLRTLAPVTAHPAALGSRLNETFSRETLPGVFTSLLYLEIREHSPTVLIMNAGHLPPAIFSGTGGRTLAKGGAALGLLATPVYAEQRVEVNEGEFIVAWSDGAVEALNEPGEQFGEERVRRTVAELPALPAAALGERLVRTIDLFAGTRAPVDDVSLLILKRTSRAPTGVGE